MNITVDELLRHSFVITVDEERYDLFKKIFSWHGLTPLPERFQGVVSRCWGPAWSCHASHKAAIEKAKELDWPFVCIFEDDAYPKMGIREKLEDVVKDIPYECSVLYFGWTKLLSKNEYDEKFYNRISNWGAHSYILFKHAYDNYLEMLNIFKCGDPC